MKNGIIYCYINKINLKCYVGQTSRPKLRYKQHLIESKNPGTNHFHRAINKYGIENFKYVILKKINITDDINYRLIMDKLESEYIIKFNSYENGYNMTKGGGYVWDNSKKIGIHLSESHKAKISNSLLNNSSVGKRDKSLSNNPKSKQVLEIDENNNIVNIYNCGKEVALKYNINYSTFRYKMKKELIINKNKFIWN